MPCWKGKEILTSQTQTAGTYVHKRFVLLMTCSVTAPSFTCRTPLHWCAKEGARQCMEALLRSGASCESTTLVSLGDPGQCARRPATFASCAFSFCPLSACLQYGDTPLHTCASSQSNEPDVDACMETLIVAGASVERLNADSETPLSRCIDVKRRSKMIEVRGAVAADRNRA